MVCTIPKKGIVNKLKIKLTIAIVRAKGRRMTNPVMKYFFIKKKRVRVLSREYRKNEN